MAAGSLGASACGSAAWRASSAANRARTSRRPPGRSSRTATEARQQVAQADQELGQLAGLLGVGVLRFDDDLRVRFANPAACTFLGREPGGLEGRSALEAFADHEVEALLLSARDRGAAGGEVRPRGEDGRALLIRARRSPWGGLWVALDDVTKLRRLERIRTEFVDNLSHELRTPLTSVRLLTETLARDLDDLVVPDRVRDRVARIDVETGHLVQMVSELLELSRIEAGGERLYLDVVDMAEAVRASCERLRALRRAAGDPPGGPHGSRAAARARRRRRLGQVLLNLIHNALKFSPSGTTVSVSAVAEAGRGDGVGRRPGAGHRPAGPGPHLRALLQGGSGPGARHGRDRPGPGHRAPHRGGPRRSVGAGER